MALLSLRHLLDMTHTILLIETDAATSSAIADALTANGFSLEVTTDLSSPLETIRQKQPHLVVMGIELSTTHNGYILCGRIKKDDKLKSIPLVLVGPSKGFEAHSKLRTRADEYVALPIDRNELVTKVKTLLGLEKPLAPSIEDMIEVTLSDAIAIPSVEEMNLNPQTATTHVNDDQIISTETEEPEEGWYADLSDTLAMPPLPASQSIANEGLLNRLEELTASLHEANSRASQNDDRIRELEAEIQSMRAQRQGFGFNQTFEHEAEKAFSVSELQAALMEKDRVVSSMKEHLESLQTQLAWLQQELDAARTFNDLPEARQQLSDENNQLKERIYELEVACQRSEERLTRFYLRMKEEESQRGKIRKTPSRGLELEEAPRLFESEPK